MNMLKFLGKGLLIVILPIVATMVASMIVSAFTALLSSTLGYGFVESYRNCMNYGGVYLIFGAVSFLSTILYILHEYGEMK